MNDFEVGSVVQLKSGGPQMTVMTSEKGVALCCWFADYYKVDSEEFDTRTIRSVETGPRTGSGATGPR